MQDANVKPEEEEEAKAEGGDQDQKIAQLTQDIFLFTCIGTLSCILYFVQKPNSSKVCRSLRMQKNMLLGIKINCSDEYFVIELQFGLLRAVSRNAR